MFILLTPTGPSTVFISYVIQFLREIEIQNLQDKKHFPCSLMKSKPLIRINAPQLCSLSFGFEFLMAPNFDTTLH